MVGNSTQKGLCSAPLVPGYMFYYCGSFLHASDVAQLSLLQKKKLKALLYWREDTIQMPAHRGPTLCLILYLPKQKRLEGTGRESFSNEWVLKTLFLWENSSLYHYTLNISDLQCKPEGKKNNATRFSALEDRVSHSNLDVTEISIPGSGKTRQSWATLIHWLLSWRDTCKVLGKHLFLFVSSTKTLEMT